MGRYSLLFSHKKLNAFAWNNVYKYRKNSVAEVAPDIAKMIR